MIVKKQKTTRENLVQTAGEIFSKNTAVELIQGERPNTGPWLLTWDGMKATIGQHFTANGITYIPVSLQPTIARALLLPAGVLPYGSTRQLFNAISALISRVTQLPDTVVMPLAFFIFATWLADRLPLAPFLWITAPPTVSTGPLLQVLHLLCRRAFLLNEPTVAALRSLPTKLSPTIVTEVCVSTRAFLNTLRASNRRGMFAVAGDKVFDLCLAKVVISNQPLRDPAVAGFPLEIVLAPSLEYIPRLDAQEAERIASEFQSKLLRYRLVNYAKVTKSIFDLGIYTAPTQEVAYGLAGCIVGDEQLQREVIPLLKARDREIKVDRASLLEAIVIEALLAACHDSKLSDLSVTEMTRKVNTIRVGRGERQEVSPEIVGWKLRGLGLRTDFITGGRKGLKLPNEIRATIHTLAAAYGVRALQQGAVITICPVCAALQKDKKTA